MGRCRIDSMACDRVAPFSPIARGVTAGKFCALFCFRDSTCVMKLYGARQARWQRAVIGTARRTSHPRMMYR